MSRTYINSTVLISSILRRKRIFLISLISVLSCLMYFGIILVVYTIDSSLTDHRYIISNILEMHRNIGVYLLDFGYSSGLIATTCWILRIVNGEK